MKRTAACGLVVGITFALYHATLLPGLDLGDTASFQATVGSGLISPRQGYPLYFAIGSLFARLNPDDPARSLNLASAVCGALATGAVTWMAMSMTGSIVAGIFGGLLLGVSYTFWSQAIIAEVYALHLLLVALSMACLLWWSNRPTTGRLGLFFLVYAVSFGNHQSMILLAPAFAWFIVSSAPGGARNLLRPQIVLLAIAAILIGASQYVGNFRYLWYGPDRPATLLDTLQAFWFDITKSDWRQSMVLAVPSSLLSDRVGMFWFDLRQQFGLIGLVLAALGVVFLRRTPARLALLAISYLACAAFAFTYNVGDSHVFFLPAHLMIALSAACGIGWLSTRLADGRAAKRWTTIVMSVASLAYPAWRAVDAYPALDRSRDTRALDLLDQMTAGLTSSNAVLVADFNWQVQNALDYYIKYRRPDVATLSLAEAIWRFPALKEANEAIGREVVLTSGSAERLRAAYGSFYSLRIDTRMPAPRMRDVIDRLPAQARYVLVQLAPARETPVDPATVRDIAAGLAGAAQPVLDSPRAYCVLAGSKAGSVVLSRAADRPFRATAVLGQSRLEVRMESWLPAETIRRAGFGHLIIDGSHAMTLERGLNLLVLGYDSGPDLVMYEESVFALQPRFVASAEP